MSGQAFSAGVVAPTPLSGRTPRPGAGRALGVAALCLIGLAALWALADLVPGAQLRDALTLHDFTLLSRPHVDSVADFLIELLEPVLFVIWGALLVAVALGRGRPRVALAVVLVMALAPLTAEILKPLLAHPRPRVGTVHIGPASWPSGHSTAALTLVLCAVLVAPRRLRALVATLGGVYALAVGCSLLILAWHMPSDVLGGYLVAALWVAIAVAALRIADRRWPSGGRRSGGAREG
jgi:membrane-associated phospholipid phosphatase